MDTEETNLDEDFKDFPKYELYLKKLNEFDKLDLTNKSTEEISKIYYSYAPIIPQLWFGQKPDRFNKHIFYRVRLKIDLNKENINMIHTYSYPHSSFCIENGRANLKNKTVFYCANSAGAAILESKPKKGDTGFLSIWEPRTEREVRFASCLTRSLRQDNEWNEIWKDMDPAVDEYLKRYAKEKKWHFIALNKLITDKYVKEKPPYPLTSWISDQFLYGENWHDIIIYPSIASETRFCNYAIHPNTVDSILKLKKVIRFKILGVEGAKFTYSPGFVGEVINTNIKWRKANEEEKKFEDFDFYRI